MKTGFFKRFISGALATLLIVAAMMTGTTAKTFDDVSPSEPFSEQIEILSDIGIIKGTSETEFSPDAPVSREQMAMLLFRFMLGKDNAGAINTTAFTDLYDDTYSGAISWANASGYIIGTSDSTFAPTAGITLQDAMAMLVRALGHSSVQMNAGYPWTYIDTAVKLGLDYGIEDLSYTKELTRAEVAVLLYNALTAEYLIPRTASNGMTFYESTTIIERVFGYEIDESVIVATNHFAIEGVELVTKDGYVSVRTEDGLLTVKFSELGLSGDADDHLGESVKLVYKRDEKTKLVSVLGCTEIGKSEAAESITVGKDHAYIQIGDVKYQVVKALSDTLATNANELLVWAYDEDGTLTQITTNEELSKLLGAFDAVLLYDEKDASTANRLLIKSYAFGQLQIQNGKINLADHQKESDLTILNPENAENGDYVLYYFNEAHNTLELAALLPITESGVVSRLTGTHVTIDGTRYKLGNTLLGVSADSIRTALTVGEKVRAVVYGDTVLAIASSSTSRFAPSQYLIAQSSATPVFSNGKFGYVIEAVIEGSAETIFVTNSTVHEGVVYRYTVDASGSYTLIPASISGGVIDSGIHEFVQSDNGNDEIAFLIDEANDSTVTKSGSYYTLSAGHASAISSTGENESEIRFVTDESTLIIVKNGDTYSISKGVYTSTLSVANGASITAIFDNEIGKVETLRYLYVSDGTLGSVDSSAASVKILASIGSEWVDGKILYLYSILNLSNGTVETMLSKSNSLTVGSNYLTSMDGLISPSSATVTNGVVTGYTSGTLSLGGETYALAKDAKIYKLNDNDEIETVKLADLYMHHVELIFDGETVQSVILLHTARFAATYAAGSVTVSARDPLSEVNSFSLLSLTKFDNEGQETSLDLSATTPTRLPDEVFAFRFDQTLESGTYRLTFEVNGVTFTSLLILAS